MLVEILIGCSRNEWGNPSAGYFFLPSRVVPGFVLKVSIVILDKKRRYLFGAILFGITSPFSTLAKSSTARGWFDFFLEISFYIVGRVISFFKFQRLRVPLQIFIIKPKSVLLGRGEHMVTSKTERIMLTIFLEKSIAEFLVVLNYIIFFFILFLIRVTAFIRLHEYCQGALPKNVFQFSCESQIFSLFPSGDVTWRKLEKILEEWTLENITTTELAW